MAKHVYGTGSPIIGKIHAYFARRDDVPASANVATPPPLAELEEIINAAFWASLRNEEGYSTRLSFAYLPPAQSRNPLEFERPLRLDPRDLAKVAPAVERPGVHLGVWPDAYGE